MPGPLSDSVDCARASWSPAFACLLRLWRQEAGACAGCDQVDAGAFAEALARHRLALALPPADTIDAGLPEPLRAVLRARQRSVTLRTLQQTASLREIVDALRGAGIRHCILKGQGYAALFGAPHRREASDIDLLIEPVDSPRALQVLQRLGHVIDPAAARDLQRYSIVNHALPLRHSRTGVVLELHLRLANRLRQFPLQGAALWERHITTVTLGNTEVATLAPAAAVAYAAFHGTKHNWHRAFWLVDMAQAMRSTTLDWTATSVLARELGIERQLVMSVLLVEATLGVPVPPELHYQAALMRAGRPLAEALLPHLDSLGSDRGADLAARMGMVRYGLRLWSLQSSWRGRLQLIPFLMAPTDDDRATLELPRYLGWAYPVVRVLRLVRGHLARRRRR